MFKTAAIFISVFCFAIPAIAQDKESKLPENTIDCSQFKKTGPQEWMEVGTAVFDLGKITDINLTNQPVKPRSFKFGGIDLYPVLEGRCGAIAYFNRGKTDQAKGDYDSALANFDQAILLDPKYAEVYDNRGSVYANKGDYARAIADYNEALRINPRLESAANHRTIASERLAKGYSLDTPAEPQVKLEVAAVVPQKEPEPNGSELTSAKIPEQTNRDQGIPISKDKIASLKSQSESGSCSAQGPRCRMRRHSSPSRVKRLYLDVVHMFHVRAY